MIYLFVFDRATHPHIWDINTGGGEVVVLLWFSREMLHVKTATNAVPITKITRPWDRLIVLIGIPLLVRRHFILRWAPGSTFGCSLEEHGLCQPGKMTIYTLTPLGFWKNLRTKGLEDKCFEMRNMALPALIDVDDGWLLYHLLR